MLFLKNQVKLAELASKLRLLSMPGMRVDGLLPYFEDFSRKHSQNDLLMYVPFIMFVMLPVPV